MKRRAFCVLALLLGLSACGSGSAQSTASSPASEKPEVKETEPAPSAAPSKEPAPAPEEAKTFEGKGTIEENTVLVDEKDLRITAVKLAYSGSGAELEILMENNSAQKLTVKSGTDTDNPTSVNGYCLVSDYSTFLMESLDAGASKTTRLSLRDDTFNTYGITDIAEMEFIFTVQDENNENYLTAGPIKLKTSSAGSYDLSEDTFRLAVEDGRFAEAEGSGVKTFVTGDYFSQDGVEVGAAVLTEDGVIYMEAENTTDQTVIFHYDEPAVNNIVFNDNGGMVVKHYDVKLTPHARTLVPVRLNHLVSADSFDMYGIQEVSGISFMGRVADAEDNSEHEAVLFEIPFSGDIPEADLSGEEVYSGNGIRLLLKGTKDTEDSYYLVFLAVNESDASKTVFVKGYYDTDLAPMVNGMRTTFNNFEVTFSPGKAAAVEFGIDKNNSSISLEGNGIAPEDIQTVIMKMAVAEGDKENVVDIPEITINLSGN